MWMMLIIRITDFSGTVANFPNYKPSTTHRKLLPLMLRMQGTHSNSVPRPAEGQTLRHTEPGAAPGVNSVYWEVAEPGLSCFPSDHENHSWNFKEYLCFSQDPRQKVPAVFEGYLGDFQTVKFEDKGKENKFQVNHNYDIILSLGIKLWFCL